MASVVFTDLSKVYPGGTRALENFNLDIADGEFVVFVGPSGCGKTTALRMVAGLEEITEGSISIGDVVVNKLEPRRRDIAMVFQNYALYPHMTVFDNIAFPLRSRHVPKAEIRTRVERAMRMLGLEELARRKPKTLSGGQRQRVAMGRAIVREPKVFLMDEPLSNLDAKLRGQTRGEITRLQRNLGTTTIYVTHDQVEAMTMGSRIVAMRKGVLQQVGVPQELYDHPSNLFVATFIGSPAMNLFCGRINRESGSLTCSVGEQQLPLGSWVPSQLGQYDGRDVAVGIRPDHMADARSVSDGRPSLAAKVRLVETLGSDRLVHCELGAKPVVTDEVVEVARDTDAAVLQSLEHESDLGVTQIVGRFVGESHDLDIGSRLEIGVDVRHLHFFDLDTGRAIRQP